MTNREKFKEVFGFEPREDAECVAPIEVCYINNDVCASKDKECPFWLWWNKEYKECFKMRDLGEVEE